MITNFTPEQEQYLQLSLTKAYHQGLRDGISIYAHWRDGVQYVGTTGKTLKEALEAINKAEQDTLEKFNMLKTI